LENNVTKPSNQLIHRRQLLQTGAMSVPAIVSATVLGADNAKPPSERITVGVIGLGARGVYVMNQFLRQPDVQVVAICDVDSFHYRDRAPGKGPAYGLEPTKAKLDKQSGESGSGAYSTSDYRKLCARDDVDAVLIATPDHWHAHCTQAAIRNGKDVYCEKPVTHTFSEGQLIYREVAESKAVFQTGTQQRSDTKFRRAVELVRNGHLGKISRIEVGLPPGYAEPQGDPTVAKPPKTLDYDMWCGPAPMLPYMRARHHRWWRGHRDFGGGVLMDWIGHHNDIAHWALDLDSSGPISVQATGWVDPSTDVYNTPKDYEILCKYEGGTINSISNRHKLGTKFIGEKGWVYVTRGKIQASNNAWTADDFDVGSERVYKSDDHVRNFLDCVKSRRACVAPAETAHRSITPGHLSYVSNALGRPLKWDAAKEVVIDDQAADELLRKNDYRKPWA
jgi:predicted dehydrogenase